MAFINRVCPLCFILVIFTMAMGTNVWSAEFYTGAISVDVTPNRPVMLCGQFGTRVATSAATPMTANILALESREGDRTLNKVIFVSMDICIVTAELRQALETSLAKALPEIDPKKDLIINATHSHTSMVTETGYYVQPKDKNVMTVAEALTFFTDRVTPGIVTAWKNRKKSQFAFGLGHAVFAQNRRSVYENDSAIMYGNTNDENFRDLEAREDHDVISLFFWNEANELLAVMVNVSCPSQEVERLRTLHADYWHGVREGIKAKWGKGVVVIPTCGAAGDVSPHIRYQTQAENRMMELRKTDRLGEIARRIVREVVETRECVESTKTFDVPLIHEYVEMPLPKNKISDEVYEDFKKQTAARKKELDADPNQGINGQYVRYTWTKDVVDRYESMKNVKNPVYPIPVHLLRIGQVAIGTNPFELATAYGTQMKARTQATQTMVIQLCAPLVQLSSAYVPTRNAARHGGYGAIPQSNSIGWEGGQLLTNQTIERLNALFK